MKSQKILVTGANGFVGRALFTELAKNGYKVRGVVRDLSRAIGLQPELTTVQDIEDRDWSSTLDGMDVVVHLAARVHHMDEAVANPLSVFRATNVEGTLSLARKAAAVGVRRFVFISSVKVNGEFSQLGKPFVETGMSNPQDPYGISKFEAEQGLLQIAQQTGMEVVIVRPPLVYGPNVKANFASMLKAVKQGIPLPLGVIKNKRSFIYIENLVSFIVLCIEHPLAANQTFLVSDGQDMSTTELLRGCAYALGVKSRLLPVPQKVLEVIARMLGKRDVVQRLCGNLQVDITKARTMLGWVPPISVGDGLKRTAASLRKVAK
ncbi:MAG TPA: SDR family oxidoreductase [Methylotenera sp.]|nr:SDR family oxidoreductase [Methylotenera sp.]